MEQILELEARQQQKGLTVTKTFLKEVCAYKQKVQATLIKLQHMN
jgi:hypothetical protein